ncbi:MAG: histidine phosphatase family protein [Candidatus Wallbacteria bacterium]|nr:histidine phosphatase family protein [Candidatus Wallbacteria bacterium]
MITTLYLVRHCQSHPSPAFADGDWPLSERGSRQARELIPVLSALGADAFVSSPYRRCLETLAPSAASLGLALETEIELRERLVSPTWVSDFREIWRRSWEDPSFAVPGGESSLDCRLRVTRAFDRLVAKYPGRTLIVGSHGNALSLFLSAFTPGYGIAQASALRTPELLRVTHGPGGYLWHLDFEVPKAFDLLATDFRETPGILAG